MKVLIGIICFILGWILGVYTRNILIKIIEIKNMIEEARKIIEEENKRKEFKEKYDFDIDINEK